MNRIIAALSLFLWTPLLAAACHAPAPRVDADTAISIADQQAGPRKKGSIFRGDVDRLIGSIARTTQKSGAAAPYGTTTLDTARILCAMGHCHRFYVAADNPRIRASLKSLLESRTRDGAFGDAATTGWVVSALQIIDGDRCADEIRTAREWLQKAHADVDPWQTTVSSVLAEVAADRFPEHLGADAATFAQESAPGVDLAVAIPTLLRLVACQTANRLLDQGQSPAAQFSAQQQKAVDFLMSQQQDGVFMAVYQGKKFPDPAITGFGLMALQTKPKDKRSKAEQVAIEKGLKWLLSTQNENGSWGRQVLNYTTSVAVGALSRWDDPAVKPALEKAQKFILLGQHVEQTGYERSDRDYGGVDYGDSQRTDLSNLNFALQALRESGLPADNEAFTKALVFMQRTQNLKSVNDFTAKVSDPDNGGALMEVTSGNDGGAGYYPGNSAAGYIVQADGKSVPRSYGSMTYALLKSYTLCGVKAEDPRVKAAVQWIQNNWTLAENPGFQASKDEKAKFAGLFYYYMVLAQALDLSGVETVTAQHGDNQQKVEWRKALREKLESMQAANGSWLNEMNPRWMEGFDVLCTCYALVALERCR